jgi:hypothetical protein
MFLDIIPISPAATLFNERLAVILGFITLAAGIIVFITCRSFVDLLSRHGIKPLSSRLYRAAYSWHIYYWWIFGIALVLHVLTAATHAVVSGRVDFIFHWLILGLGLASLVVLVPVLLSCRSTALLLDVVAGSLTRNKFYEWFYRRHGALWWPLAVVTLAHVSASVIHVNWWPTSL